MEQREEQAGAEERSASHRGQSTMPTQGMDVPNVQGGLDYSSDHSCR